MLWTTPRAYRKSSPGYRIGEGTGHAPHIETLRQSPGDWEQLYAVTSDSSIRTSDGQQKLTGIVVAEIGPFKSGRGQFDRESLRLIVELINADRLGIRSHFTHGDGMSDRLGDYLGRVTGAAMSETRNRVPCVRATLSLADSSFLGRGWGEYVLALARSDPAAISASLVLRSEQIPQRSGPPVWRPIELRALDVVSVGDAVGALL